VIRGETPHFDYVCQGATAGMIQAMLDTGVPMAFGVLTTENEAQARSRASQDENNKGREAARTAVEMVRLKKQVSAF
jgi:6,7-dimethyl-8-ribityllumazine synthase